MGKIYVGQTKLRLIVETNADLTDATKYEIKCKKPSNATATFTATCDDQTGGEIYYNFTTGDLDENGRWLFWAYITFSDGEIPGEAFKIQVYNQGE